MKELLALDNFSVTYFNSQGRCIEALLYLSLEIAQGEVFGLVGESGSGKSTLGNAIMQILPKNTKTDGAIGFMSRTETVIDLVKATERQMNNLRGNEIAMIFQEPAASFNPVFTIGNQMQEFIRYKTDLKTKKQTFERAKQCLLDAGIEDPEVVLKRYPHQLSGGQLQRAMIAQALCTEPKLLIADEPTSSLDVTIESKILNLLIDLKEKKGLSILFITHDLDIAASICDKIAVLCEGKLQDIGTPEQVLNSPTAEYTKELVAAFKELGEI